MSQPTLVPAAGAAQPRSATLYLSDLDGTLVCGRAGVTPATARIINALIGQGLLFSVITGRTFSSAQRLLAPLDLQLPIGVLNGAELRDPRSGRVVRGHYVGAAAAEQAVRMILRAGLDPVVVRSGAAEGVFYRPLQSAAARQWLDDSRDNPLLQRVEQLGAVLAGGSLTTVFTCGQEQTVRQLAGSLAARLGPDAQVGVTKYLYVRDLWLLEVQSPEAHKGAALRALAEQAAVPLADTIAIGDSYNDLPMFDLAGYRVVVEGADAPILERADRRIGPCLADSVALFLQERWQQTVRPRESPGGASRKDL